MGFVDFVKRIFQKRYNQEECKECKYEFRYTVYSAVFWVIIIGAIVPFLVQFVLPILLLAIKVINVEEYNVIKIPGIEIWNQYTSIILGVVATIMSIVSMYLGFKNSDDSTATERRINENISKLEHETTEVLEKQSQILDSLKESLQEQRNIKEQIMMNGKIVSFEQKKKEDWKSSKDNSNADE